MQPQHDLIVIGDDTAAHAAALEGARLGLDVLLVQPLGSDAEQVELAPTLRPSLACRILANLSDTRPFQTGSERRAIALDALRLIEGCALAYVESWRSELRRSQVACLRSPVRFREPGELELSCGARSAAAIVISEAARPRRPGFFPFDDRVVWDCRSIFRSGVLPRSLAVVGADEDGCQIACVFAALGASVVLIDRRVHLMRGIDRDVLRIVHARMQEAGIDIVLGEELEEVRVVEHRREPHAVLDLGSGRREHCDGVVVCAGSIPDVESAAVGSIDVDRDPRGFLLTDEHGRMSQPGMWAVGAISGLPPNLATQIHRARVAVFDAAGLAPQLEDQAPQFIHTIPEIASMGLTDEACSRLGISHLVGTAIYPPRTGGGEGLLKLVAESGSGRLLGIHVVGPAAGDTLQIGLEYLRRDAPLDYVAGAILNTPGPAEAYRSAAHDALARMQPRNLRHFYERLAGETT